MRLIKATNFEAVKQLYIEAFPKYERKPLCMIKRYLKSGKYELYILHDQDNLAGFILTVPVANTNIVMLDYLAVNTSQRGKGYGSTILSEMLNVYHDKKVFLTMEQVTPEADNYEQRLKRQAFYFRNGWLDTGLLTDGYSGKMHVLSPFDISESEYITAQKYALGKLLFAVGKMTVKKVK